MHTGTMTMAANVREEGSDDDNGPRHGPDGPGWKGRGAHGTFYFFLFIYSTNIYLQIDDLYVHDNAQRPTSPTTTTMPISNIHHRHCHHLDASEHTSTLTCQNTNTTTVTSAQNDDIQGPRATAQGAKKVKPQMKQ